MSPVGFCIRYLLAFLKGRLLKLFLKKKKNRNTISQRNETIILNTVCAMQILLCSFSQRYFSTYSQNIYVLSTKLISIPDQIIFRFSYSSIIYLKVSDSYSNTLMEYEQDLLTLHSLEHSVQRFRTFCLCFCFRNFYIIIFFCYFSCSSNLLEEV